MTPTQLLEHLSRPHVAINWLCEIDYPDGLRRYHDGFGTVTTGGRDWQGVNDPAGAQVVAIAPVRMPKFGQAPFVDIIIAGASNGFIRSYWINRTDFEGAECNIYYRTVDTDTGEELIPLRRLFPGRLTAGRIERTGQHFRTLSFKVVSTGEGLNFPATKWDWTSAGQRARYPGDKGLDFIKADIVTEFR